MTRFKNFAWRTRKRQAATVVALMFASAGIALAAAWFTGTLTGSGSGSVGGASSIGAITLSPSGNSGSLTPGGSSDVAYNVSNPTGHTVTITAVTVGAITASPSCDTSAISFNGALLVGLSYPPGATNGVQISNAFSATSGLSAGCQLASLNVALSGTTNGS
jgi:hypothetical protein